MSPRADKRELNQLREITFVPNYIIHPEGSILACFGNTKVLCNATVESEIPRWMRDQEEPGGWITGEYAMLPRSTHTRSRRENKGPKGRSSEIQRLIGRSLRAGFNLEKLSGHTITIDCDVLQADGGTRTTAISGGYLAARIAVEKLIADGALSRDCLLAPVAAISVGILKDEHFLDLCYTEDVEADVDANVVMNADGNLIEVQSTAEGKAFSRSDLSTLVELAWGGIQSILHEQEKVLENVR